MGTWFYDPKTMTTKWLFFWWEKTAAMQVNDMHKMQFVHSTQRDLFTKIYKIDLHLYLKWGKYINIFWDTRIKIVSRCFAMAFVYHIMLFWKDNMGKFSGLAINCFDTKQRLLTRAEQNDSIKVLFLCQVCLLQFVAS